MDRYWWISQIVKKPPEKKIAEMAESAPFYARIRDLNATPDAPGARIDAPPKPAAEVGIRITF